MLKEFLVTPPILCRPTPGILLLLYMSVAYNVVNLVLVQEIDKEQGRSTLLSESYKEPR